MPVFFRLNAASGANFLVKPANAVIFLLNAVNAAILPVKRR